MENKTEKIYLDAILYDHFYSLEEKVVFSNFRHVAQQSEELSEAYEKIKSYLDSNLKKYNKYKLVDTKKLETVDSNFMYDHNCEYLKEYFDDSRFGDCIDFEGCRVYENLQCDYCKLYHLVEHNKNNDDCIKVIKE